MMSSMRAYRSAEVAVSITKGCRGSKGELELTREIMNTNNIKGRELLKTKWQCQAAVEVAAQLAQVRGSLNHTSEAPTLMFLAAAATKPAPLLDKESQVSLPTLAKTAQVDLACPIEQAAPAAEAQAPC